LLAASHQHLQELIHSNNQLYHTAPGPFPPHHTWQLRFVLNAMAVLVIFPHTSILKLLNFLQVWRWLWGS